MFEKIFVCFILYQILFADAKFSGTEYNSMPDVFHLDNFDRCMLYDNTYETTYCSVTFTLYPKNSTNKSQVWKTIEKISAHPKNFRHDILRWGICIKDSCKNIDNVTIQNPYSDKFKEDLTECLNDLITNDGIEGILTELHCEDKEFSYPFDIYDILFVLVVAAYLTIVIFGTFYEGLARYGPKDKYNEKISSSFGKVVSCFSIIRNWERLSRINLDDPVTKALSGINGIRFYNMFAIILSHTILGFATSPILNTRFMETINDSIFTSILSNGGYVVQTFFIISGWLVCYNILKTFEEKSKVPISYLINAFIHRYIRLTPVLALVIFFHCTFVIHLGSGPFWHHRVHSEFENCRQNWWTNLLYINTYVNRETMCQQHTWYIATDTQLFIVSLVIIWLIKKFEKKAVHILTLSMIISVLIPIVICYFKEYDIIVRKNPESVWTTLLLDPAWHGMFSPAEANITGYIIGITFGYIFYKTKDQEDLLKNRIYSILWWILTFIPSFAVILAGSIMYNDDYTFTPIESGLYWSLGRLFFGFSMAVLIFGMTHNISGWIMTSACQWPPVMILGRLTFCAYLLHVFVLRFRAANGHERVYMQPYLMGQAAISDVVQSYILALIITITLEMPITALQKLSTTRSKNKEES